MTRCRIDVDRVIEKKLRNGVWPAVEREVEERDGYQCERDFERTARSSRSRLRRVRNRSGASQTAARPSAEVRRRRGVRFFFFVPRVNRHKSRAKGVSSSGF